MQPDRRWTPAERRAGGDALDAWLTGLGLPASLVQSTRPYGAVAAVLDAVAPLIAARVTEPWRKRAEALEALLACYRTGRQPSEALHRRLEKTRTAIAATTTEGTDHA